tara:strand:- start:6503 stop:7531 length:1029 start_codon:yes stop_codon:yes gene_type:complete
MIIRDKKLQDPLLETSLPNIFNILDINHWSSTQGSYADGPWFFRYGICDQKTRRLFDGNAKMAAGVAVGSAIQYNLANEIWKINPNTQKLSPFVNEKLTLDLCIQKVQEEFNNYKPVNEKDQIGFDRYKETIPQTVLQLREAVETLGISGDVVAESILSFHDKRLLLPTVGRSDLELLTSSFAASSSSSSIASGSSFSLLEIKTSWDRVSKQKKDGSWSFVNAKTPVVPSRNHLLQCAFYKKCKPEARIHLIYVVKDGFKIFNEVNCQDLSDENLENYYEELFKVFQRRERLIMRYDNLSDKDQAIAEIVKDLDPVFDHPYLWSIGSQFVHEAKKLWNAGGV